MADLMSDQKRLFERGSDVLVKNELILMHECCAPVVEYDRPGSRWLYVKAPPLCLRHCKGIGSPRVETPSDRFHVKIGCGLSSDLDRIHITRLRSSVVAFLKSLSGEAVTAEAPEIPDYEIRKLGDN